MKKLLLFSFLIFLFLPITSQAQNGFKYQAVVRDNDGKALLNQFVGLKIGLIQNTIDDPATYIETHHVETNDFGIINIMIGHGIVEKGTFTGLDWSKDSYAQIHIDIEGGTNYQLMGTSELVAVPKAMYAETAQSVSNAFGLNVRDFGAKGNNTKDDTEAFQLALDSAAIIGNKIIVPVGNYLIKETLIVPDGVTIIGEGVGSTGLGTPYNGSAIRYDGNGDALQFSGHTSGMRDMLIYDNAQGANEANGIHVLADGKLVESLRFFNVLIHYFTGGTALKLNAVNGGGIAYCSFYSIRIRHAKIGIHIIEDGPSFTNSNSFNHGAISGGGFDYGILVDGGNNNQFYGTVVEPGSSNSGHLVVNEGEIQGHNIRIEGNSQADDKALVEFKSGTMNSFINGTYAGGLTLDKGNNFIAFRNGKNALFQNSNDNLFENAGFYGLDNNQIPYWDITGNGVQVEVVDSELISDHKVLKLTIPSGTIANLKPVNSAIPNAQELAQYKQLNVGIHAKLNQAGIAYWRTNAPEGLTISQAHSGNGEWQYISMSNLVNQNATLDTRFEVNNNTGSTIEIFLTTPSFNFGNRSPKLAAKPINSNGGIVNGVLTTSMVTIGNPSAGNFWILPKEANVFEINGTVAMHRINSNGVDRFPKGTVINLLFNNAGLNVLNSAYIKLKSNYTSTTNSSLTLISLGNGTWRELSRNL